MLKKATVIVAENQTLTRKGYVSLLNGIDNIEVIGEAENGRELLKLLETKAPTLVMLDLEMPVMGGKEVLQIMKIRYPSVKVIILSFHTEEPLIVECIKFGACAFIAKDSTYETFLEGIENVRTHGFYYSQGVARALVSELHRKHESSYRDYNITEREAEIIVLICDGKTNKEIATELKIVPSTVDFHKQKIYKKTNTINAMALYSFAVKTKLIVEREQEN